MLKLRSDTEYLDQLIQRGRAFTYRGARTTDPADRTWEMSRDKWTEWFAEAEATVNRLAEPRSEATELIKKARHLEISGELPQEFYESRELAVNALLICAAGKLNSPVPAVGQDVRPGPRVRSVWNRYGREILIGVAATVIGGLLLALLL